MEKSHSSNDRDVTLPLVISTKAGQPPIGKPLIVQARGQLRLTWKLYAESPQSGEISLPHGTQNIGAGDLSTLSHIKAEVHLLPYQPLPPLEMTMVAGSLPEKSQKRLEKMDTHFFTVFFFPSKKAPQEGELFPVLQASAALAFLVRKY